MAAPPTHHHLQEKAWNYTVKVLTLPSKWCSWDPAKVMNHTWHLLSAILPNALGCVSSDNFSLSLELYLAASSSRKAL